MTVDIASRRSLPTTYPPSTIMRLSNSDRSIRSDGDNRSVTVAEYCTYRTQLNSIRVMDSVAVAFLVAWTPYALAAYVAQFGPAYIISPIMMTVLSVIAKSNTMVNPVIYMCSNASFRSCVLKTVGLLQYTVLKLLMTFSWIDG